MTNDYDMYIGGRWVESSTQQRFDAINPYDQTVWATIPEASPEDVRSAVAAAREAFETSWRFVNARDRARLLHRLADAIDANADRLARLESTDNGKVIRETSNQMRFASRNFRFYAAVAETAQGSLIPLDDPHLLNYTVPEPYGVVLLITSWNSPISILSTKLAPALCAGNTVVIKPSEHASATALEIARLVEEVGFPAGVVNVVTGGATVGNILTTEPGIDKISFTGGTETGRIVAANASRHLVPLTLELGGKSPNIVFEDANLVAALRGAVAGIYGASGQTCIAGSRLLVQDSIYDEVVAGITEASRKIRLGDPLLPETEMGPVATKGQHERILGLIDSAIQDGARRLTGERLPDDVALGRGFFVPPTVFDHVDRDMAIARTEVFGPVLCVLRFRDEEEALSIANATDFGLAAGLWTRSVERAHRVARGLNSGTVWVNTYRTNAVQAPVGGRRLSGYGRERGIEAVREFVQVKNVMINLSDSAADPFSVRV